MSYYTSDAVLDLLEHFWVTTMFGYPWGTIMPFYDRIHNHKIKHILVRNEQAAGFAASWWARSTWKLWVCVATSGPGGTNVLTAIADAYLDSVPLLFITGQVPSNMLGKDMFQEVDMMGLTMNITKHNFLVTNPDNIVQTFVDAIEIATSGRPWPVHIDFPKDIQLSKISENFIIPKSTITSRIPKRVEMNRIDKILTMINSAKKPILIVGHGVKLAWAEDELNSFINKTGIPTVTTLLAKWIISPNNENYLWMLWMHGFYHSNIAVNKADLIINIGSRFDDRIVGTYDSFWKNAKIIHVDIDKAELDKVVKADLSINADAKVFLGEILSDPNIIPLEISDWKKMINSYKKEKPYEEKTKFFSMRNVLNKIQSIMEENLDDYIIVTDVGQHQMFCSLNLKIENPKNWLTSWGAGTMWFGLPNAIWAALANPEKTVIIIAGDGGIQMNIQELATIKDHSLNIKIIVLNNHFLWMVRQWQELFFDKNYSEVFITSPEFAQLAESYGIEGDTINNEEELKEKLEERIYKKWPVMINIHIEQEENLFPMVPAGKTLWETIVEKS